MNVEWKIIFQEEKTVTITQLAKQENQHLLFRRRVASSR